MNAKKGVTKADVLITVVCLVFLIINMKAISAGGRGRAKRAVCEFNLRSLTAGWHLYADDNAGKIPVGDVWYSWIFSSASSGSGLKDQLAWHEWPHPWPHEMPPNRTTNYYNAYPLECTKADWEHAIAEGTLWPYIKDYEIYKCPAGNRGEYVTYSMVHSMNTYPLSGGTAIIPPPTIRNKIQIHRPADRIVFLDVGFAHKGAFFVRYSGSHIARWMDQPPMRHGQGTSFAFADGHCEYRKWTDEHALEAAEKPWGAGPDDECDCDLRWFVKAVWGDILYDCETGECSD